MDRRIEFEPFVRFNINFSKNFDEIIFLLKKILLNKEDLSQVILLEEALLIKVAAEWEYYIHHILAYCISLDTTKLSEELSLILPTQITLDNAYAILNGLNYISIKGRDDLKSKAKKFILPQYNPFDSISNSMLKEIDKLYTLRNHIAHRSKPSKRSLEKLYKSLNVFDFIEPGYYLNSVYTQDDVAYSNSFKLYGALNVISIEVWKFLDRKSYDYIFKEYDDLEKSITESNAFELQENYFKALDKMKQVFKYLEESSI